MANINIKALRSTKGLKQSELADILKLTQSSLSRIETNNTDLTEEQIKKLEEYFGADALIEFRDTPSYTLQNFDTSTEPESSRDMLAIIKKQNDTICQQMDLQNKMNESLYNLSTRMMNLLEKLTMK